MIEIVKFQPTYAVAFKALNYAWIKDLFEIEASDKKMLENPQEEIIDKGGSIFIALMNNEPVGACALVRKSDQTFELAKMAVDKKARGNQIGYLLGNEIVEEAKRKNAEKVILETNSQLTPAINLYHKLGFNNSCGQSGYYHRCDIKMELVLK